MSHDRYQSPLSERYASREMGHIFSPQKKHALWRRLWIALAEAQKELGLTISQEQIDELKKNSDAIDFEAARNYETKFRHDVMAHIHTYGDLCPKARPIIHLGATSCYVTDNGDILQMREALELLEKKLARAVRQLAGFADAHKTVACLGFTHYQPAQLTTVGKRACLWIQDLLMDLNTLSCCRSGLKLLGAKGATGTQASFLSLFDGDRQKVRELDRLVCKKMGFTEVFPITGQTYSRKQDAAILNALSGIAVSAHKCAGDLRLLANLKEMEEPFEKSQVGSSAMPYKRNPMLSERICSLARFLISLSENGAYTAAAQWFERTLDDSANRRLALSEAFLTADALCNLLIRVTEGLLLYPKVIERRVREELPFMATENILMASVQKGGDRQTLHEKLRAHSIEAARKVKEEGKENDLLQRIENDAAFPLTSKELEEILNVEHFVGMAPEQTEAFIANEVWPIVEPYAKKPQEQLSCPAV